MTNPIRAISIALLCNASLAQAATIVCVNDVPSFQAALLAAVGNTSTTIIEVARGTYNLGGTPLAFGGTSSQGQLDITGGYNGDCSSVIENPALTVIDGQGLSEVLDLEGTSSTGGFSVRYLTLQNGTTTATNRAAGLYIGIQGGGIIVDYNIIRNNSGTGVGGLSAGIYGAADTQNIHVDGNLIVGNDSSDNAGVYVENGGSGNIYVTNNTIADNTITNPGGAPVGGIVSGSPAVLSNNIIWNNAVYDVGYFGSSPVLVNDDAGTIRGTIDPSSNGNLDVDPQFAGGGDYHLLPVSPLLGQGTLTPAGGLPTIEIEGNPRSYNGFVDIGAYERGDEIFTNDFDH